MLLEVNKNLGLWLAYHMAHISGSKVDPLTTMSGRDLFRSRRAFRGLPLPELDLAAQELTSKVNAIRCPSSRSLGSCAAFNQTEVQGLAEAAESKKQNHKLDAEDVMRELERMAVGNPRLVRTLLYLLKALDVDLDFAQVRAPSQDELIAVYHASPGLGARMVTAYSDLMTVARRTTQV